MIVPVHNAANGESSIIWTGKQEDLVACCNLVFGDGEPCALPFHTGTGVVIVEDRLGADVHVRPGDMIHRDAEGKIRVLVPVEALPENRIAEDG